MSEIGSLLIFDQVAFFAGRVFYWIRFVDNAEMFFERLW